MGDMPPPPPRRPASHGLASDDAVRRTNDDASASKLACAAKGYVDDPYVRHFARPGRAFPPLINRGYHARVTAVRAVVDAFLDARLRGAERVPPGGASDRQIVSIGAGFDTTYFRLRAERRAPASFVEIDHEEIVRAKARVVSAAPELRELCEGARGVARVPPLADEEKPIPDESPSAPGGDGDGEVSYRDAGGYRLVAAGLRDRRRLDAVAASHVDPTLPTLVLAECCLAYLPGDAQRSTLAWAATRVVPRRSRNVPVAFASYDPIAPDGSPFARQMLLNLAARGCSLEGARDAPSPREAAERLRAAGFDGAVGAATMAEVAATLARCDPREFGRVQKIEPLDEVEELRLMQEHYVFAWGVRGAGEDAEELAKRCFEETVGGGTRFPATDPTPPGG